ncbi:MAG: alpha/beta hydrolase [Maricaulaceae bacterium]
MAPPGAPVPVDLAPYLHAFYIPHEDINLRVVLAKNPDFAARGTIIIVPGRTEFIEKYFEMVDDFLNRRFAVLVIDHRGQGLSSRLLDDPLKSYVKQFQDYADDLGFIVDELGSHLPKPQIIVAHSMGGCVAFQSVISGTLNPAALICSAPMLCLYDLHTAPLQWFIKGLAAMGQSTKNVPLMKKTNGLPVKFKRNKLTSDIVRFTRWASYFTHIPALRVSVPTIGWLRGALTAMRFVNRNAAQVKTPTLLLSAGADPIVDPAAHVQFAKKSGATLKIIPGARHELFLEADEFRDQFFESVDIFLDKNAF